MTFVVDTSVAVKWVVDEPDRSLARCLLDTVDRIEAPDFVFVEAANVLWKKVQRRELSGQQAVEGLDALFRLIESIVPSNLLVERALRIAIDMARPVCDCLYLACVEHSKADLVTANARFAAKAGTSFSGASAYALSEFGGARC